MKTSIVLASLLFASWQAFALAPSGGEPNNTGCNGVGNSNSPCQPSNTNENTNGQSQAQGQGQAQGQIANGGNGTGIGVGLGGEGGRGGSANASGGSATSGSSSGALSGSVSGATGGSVGDTSSSASNGDQSTAVDASSGSTSGASANNSGGNSTTHVDASNNSRYSSQVLFLPTIQAAAPTFAPGAMATVVHGQCGPLMAVQSEEVTGTYLGLFRKHSIPLGRTDRIIPYDGGEYISHPYPDGSTRLFGHRAVRTTAVVTISGSRQVGAGGGQTGGGYGQLGVGGGSSMQRVVTQIDLEPCEAFHSVPAAPVAVSASPAPAPVRRVVKRRPAPAMCVPRPAMVCPAK